MKIDRSFISGEVLAPGERQTFLQAIVGLAGSLELRSVAEGIEDERQLEELRGLDCDIGQGYHWSQAVPLTEMAATIDRIESMLSSTLR